ALLVTVRTCDQLRTDALYSVTKKRERTSAMRRTILIAMVLAAFTSLALAQTKAAKPLDIYIVDVEGGNAVLFVTPGGESFLIDTGNVGVGAARDAGRIADAAKDAGVKQIDHLIITHYHGDHLGGLPELAKRMPIQEFFDHGMNVQPGPAADAMLKTYSDLYAKGKHMVVKPGDKIPVAGLDWRIVSSAGEVLKTPLPGAG